MKKLITILLFAVISLLTFGQSYMSNGFVSNGNGIFQNNKGIQTYFVKFTEVTSLPVSPTSTTLYAYNDSVWFYTGISWINMNRTASSLKAGNGITITNDTINLDNEIVLGTVKQGIIGRDSTYMSFGNTTSTNEATFNTEINGDVYTYNQSYVKTISGNWPINHDSTGLHYVEDIPNFNLLTDNHFTTKKYVDSISGGGVSDSSWLSARVDTLNIKNIGKIYEYEDGIKIKSGDNTVVVGGGEGEGGDQLLIESDGAVQLTSDINYGGVGPAIRLVTTFETSTTQIDIGSTDNSIEYTFEHNTLRADSVGAKFKTVSISGQQAATTNYVTQAIDSLSLAETVSRTIYVATTGSDVTGDGSVGSPFATYSKAILNIKPIVNYNVVITIDIAAGTYNEDFVTIDKYFSKIYWSKSSSFIVNGKFATDVSGLTITTAGGSNAYVYNVTGGTFTANQYQDYFISNGTTWYPIVYNGVSTINTNVGATGCTSIVHNTVIFNVTNGNMFVNSSVLNNGQTFEFNNIDINYAGAFIFSNNILLDVNKSKITCTNGQLAVASYRNNFTSCAFVNSSSSFTINSARVQFKQCSLRKSGTLTGTGLAVSNNYYSVPIIGSGGLYLYNWAVAWASQSVYCFNNQGALVIDGCTTGFTFRNNSFHQWTTSSPIYVNSVGIFLAHGETLERNYGFYVHILSGTPTTMLGSGITTNGLCNISKNIHIEIPSISTQGTAILVAGTVTINTAAVQTSSEILVSCKTPGGTQGFLSLGTITAGTSFVVNSSSATDTSTILWQIVK